MNNEIRRRLDALVQRWRDSARRGAHTYASENADHYRGFDAGLIRCADQLAAEIAALGREGEPLNVDAVVQAVAELPDRTSPEDWPDAMLVTADELRAILIDAGRAAEAPPVEPKE